MSARGRGKAGRGGWERKLPPLDCTRAGRHDLADPDLASTHDERTRALSTVLRLLPGRGAHSSERWIARALLDCHELSFRQERGQG
jgi:hypothetical protein